MRTHLGPLHLLLQKSWISCKNRDLSKKAGFRQRTWISGSFFMDFIVGAHGRLELQKSGISDTCENQLFCTKSLFFAWNPGFLQNQMAKNLDFRVHTVGAHRNPGFLSVGGWNPGFLLKSRFFAPNPAFLQSRWRGLWWGNKHNRITQNTVFVVVVSPLQWEKALNFHSLY